MPIAVSNERVRKVTQIYEPVDEGRDRLDACPTLRDDRNAVHDVFRYWGVEEDQTRGRGLRRRGDMTGECSL